MADATPSETAFRRSGQGFHANPNLLLAVLAATLQDFAQLAVKVAGVHRLATKLRILRSSGSSTLTLVDATMPYILQGLIHPSPMN